MSESHRHAVRLRLDRGVILLRQPGVASISCSILDLSETGCQCQLNLNTLEPQTAGVWREILVPVRPISVEITEPQELRNLVFREAELRWVHKAVDASLELGISFGAIENAQEEQLQKVMLSIAAEKLRSKKAAEALTNAMPPAEPLEEPPFPDLPSVSASGSRLVANASPRPLMSGSSPRLDASPSGSSSTRLEARPLGGSGPRPETPGGGVPVPGSSGSRLAARQTGIFAAVLGPPPPTDASRSSGIISRVGLHGLSASSGASGLQQQAAPLGASQSGTRRLSMPAGASGVPPSGTAMPAAFGGAPPSTPALNGAGRMMVSSPDPRPRAPDQNSAMGPGVPAQNSPLRPAFSAQTSGLRPAFSAQTSGLRPGISAQTSGLRPSSSAPNGTPQPSIPARNSGMFARSAPPSPGTPQGGMPPPPPLAIPAGRTGLMPRVSAAASTRISAAPAPGTPEDAGASQPQQPATGEKAAEGSSPDSRQLRETMYMPALFEFCGPEKEHWEATIHRGRTIDFNEGGFKIEGPAPECCQAEDLMLRGAHLFLTVRNQNAELKAFCQVRSVVASPLVRTAWHYGVMIIEMSDDDRRQLREMYIRMGFSRAFKKR